MVSLLGDIDGYKMACGIADRFLARGGSPERRWRQAERYAALVADLSVQDIQWFIDVAELNARGPLESDIGLLITALANTGERRRCRWTFTYDPPASLGDRLAEGRVIEAHVLGEPPYIVTYRKGSVEERVIKSPSLHLIDGA